MLLVVAVSMGMLLVVWISNGVLLVVGVCKGMLLVVGVCKGILLVVGVSMGMLPLGYICSNKSSTRFNGISLISLHCHRFQVCLAILNFLYDIIFNFFLYIARFKTLLSVKKTSVCSWIFAGGHCFSY